MHQPMNKATPIMPSRGGVVILRIKEDIILDFGRYRSDLKDGGQAKSTSVNRNTAVPIRSDC